jgi:hypothetical protein
MLGCVAVRNAFGPRTFSTLTDVEQRAKTLLAETREELVRADAKATPLLGVNGILVAAVLAGVIAGNFSPSDLSCWAEPLFWFGAAAVLLAEALLCAAVFPRVGHPQNSPSPVPPRYFGDVARIDSCEQLAKALEQEEDAAERALNELFALSRVAVMKYRLIAAALFALAIGVIACAVAVLVNGA